MASILPVKKGFRAFVNKKGIRETKTFYNRYVANAWASQREQEITSGTSPKQIAKAHTLHRVFERFRDEDALQRRGKRWEVARINRFMVELKDMPLADFAKEHIVEWRNARLKAVKGASVRRDMTLLRTILETARAEWGWITENPIADVKKPPPSPARKRMITEAEIAAVVKALGYTEGDPVASVGQTIAVAFLIALETGMRAGELMKAVVRGNVALLLDQEVTGDATKNGDEREVPLSRRARDLFAMVHNKVDLNPGSLDTMFRKARKDAGLSGFTFHDSRHFACTRLAKKLQPMDLARMLGHRSLKQTLAYYNPDASDLADLLD